MEADTNYIVVFLLQKYDADEPLRIACIDNTYIIMNAELSQLTSIHIKPYHNKLHQAVTSAVNLNALVSRCNLTNTSRYNR